MAGLFLFRNVSRAEVAAHLATQCSSGAGVFRSAAVRSDSLMLLADRNPQVRGSRRNLGYAEKPSSWASPFRKKRRILGIPIPQETQKMRHPSPAFGPWSYFQPQAITRLFCGSWRCGCGSIREELLRLLWVKCLRSMRAWDTSVAWR